MGIRETHYRAVVYAELKESQAQISRIFDEHHDQYCRLYEEYYGTNGARRYPSAEEHQRLRNFRRLLGERPWRRDREKRDEEKLDLSVFDKDRDGLRWNGYGFLEPGDIGYNHPRCFPSKRPRLGHGASRIGHDSSRVHSEAFSAQGKQSSASEGALRPASHSLGDTN